MTPEQFRAEILEAKVNYENTRSAKMLKAIPEVLSKIKHCIEKGEKTLYLYPEKDIEIGILSQMEDFLNKAGLEARIFSAPHTDDYYLEVNF